MEDGTKYDCKVFYEKEWKIEIINYSECYKVYIIKKRNFDGAEIYTVYSEK
jgi:hypothetical protein